MNAANVFTNPAGWMMLTASMLSAGFLLWFLVGVIVEGKKTRFYYVICCDEEKNPAIRVREEQKLEKKASSSPHSKQMDLRQGTRQALRKSA